jgi:BolA protein
MMPANERCQAITSCLEQALQPSQLNVIDDSHKHIGHSGAKTGMGHFTVEIQANRLNGLSRMAQHRLIYQALGELMQTDIHALSIKVL